MTHRRFSEMFQGTSRFSRTTRTRLEGSVARALLGHQSATTPLREAVCFATRELRAEGLSESATLAVLGALVEDAGRACGADKISLFSGDPRWAPVRARVLESAEGELALARITSCDPVPAP